MDTLRKRRNRHRRVMVLSDENRFNLVFEDISSSINFNRELRFCFGVSSTLFRTVDGLQQVGNSWRVQAAGVNVLMPRTKALNQVKGYTPQIGLLEGRNYIAN